MRHFICRLMGYEYSQLLICKAPKDVHASIYVFFSIETLMHGVLKTVALLSLESLHHVTKPKDDTRTHTVKKLWWLDRAEDVLTYSKLLHCGLYSTDNGAVVL